VFQHVPIQPRDAREASDVFYKQKTGDALLTYENEVIMTNMSQAAERRLPYVVPQNNVSVHTAQHPTHPLSQYKCSAVTKPAGVADHRRRA
jgi:ABC-type sulfate transport system substrate-binding protein